MSLFAPNPTGQPTPAVAEGTAQEIEAMLLREPAEILTFVGYSAAEYEDPAGMLAQARQVLAACDPHETVVNIGATEQGIGAVYALAKVMGFGTLGVVSTLARLQNMPLSPWVDRVCFVHDLAWGGVIPGTVELSPTSTVIVNISHRLVGIGGGEAARDELLAARRAGLPVVFFPADMNHRIAYGKAARQGLPPPEMFCGAAHAAWMAAF